MDYIFVYVCGKVQTSDDIPAEILNKHASGEVRIIHAGFGAVLNSKNDWQEIEVIEKKPKMFVRKIGGRMSGKTCHLA